MKIFLAGSGLEKVVWLKDNFFSFNRLHTFYDIKEFEAKIIHKYDSFLLDSGAFSFFGKTGQKIDKYLDEYISFINKYNVNLFFELDLYTLPEYGIKKTEEIREYIETRTNKKTIPVFHKICGINYFYGLCEKYKYVAISASGMYDSKWTRTNPKKLKQLVLYANSKGVRVHGLGYTKIANLSEIPFYSVDSTSWLSGNRVSRVTSILNNWFTMSCHFVLCLDKMD